MKPKLILLIIISALMTISWVVPQINWLSEKQKGYTLVYTSIDKNSKKEYKKIIGNGLMSVNAFFGSPFNKEFHVFIHPSRYSLDTTWQKDWKMPAFKSECWMVASGDAGKLDMISPKRWDSLSCEHKYGETIHTQQLITHELVHVFHAQSGIDYNNTDSLDWFIEGLATFASGQCDSLRIAEVKKAINDNKIPKRIGSFWTGKIKYGLAGSLVMYIDHRYGRVNLKELLPLSKKSELLSILKTTESELLNGWKEYVRKL